MMRRMVLACVALGLGACAGGEEAEVESRFRKQFQAWYAAHPPSAEARPEAERALLERYKPIWRLGADARDPMDFYADYIARGALYAADGAVLAQNPDARTLNAHRDEIGLRFVHDGPAAQTHPVAYGRVAVDDVPFVDGARRLTFLTYNLAFEVSGLPWGLSWWQEWPMWAAGDVEDWHQLDHYVAVTLALDMAKTPPEPVAAIFQQHNYQRSYRFGGAAGAGRLDWPEDGRLTVDVALRSNELYPAAEGETRRRAASFMGGSQAQWLVMGTGGGMQSAYDVTRPDRRLADLPLQVLPHADAFYTFRSSLGEKRTLPGRSGPPGADYNTLAAMKAPAAQLLCGYWREGLADYLPLSAAAGEAAWNGAPVDLAPFAALWAKDWAGEGQ